MKKNINKIKRKNQETKYEQTKNKKNDKKNSNITKMYRYKKEYKKK